MNSNSETTDDLRPAQCTEAELRDNFRNLLQFTTDLVYFKDRDSTFTLASSSLERALTQSDNQSIVGRSDFDFYDQEIASVFFDDEQAVMNSGRPIIGRVEKVSFDGKDAWVDSTKIALRDENGSTVGVFGISRDITEQRQTEANLAEATVRLAEASRLAGKAEIATDVIHNVSDVLNSINIALHASEMLSSDLNFGKLEQVAGLIEKHGCDEEFFQDDKQGSHIPNYLREVAELASQDKARLKKELADCEQHIQQISAIVARQQQYATNVKVFDSVNISDLISDAILISSKAGRTERIDIQRDFEEDLTVKTDKHHVSQIVADLIRNAKRACIESENRPSAITIAASNHGDEMFKISVADNGIGITKANFLKLFNFGFTTREDGTGFALHSCANTAKELGGSLKAKSDGHGKGATFTLTLPGQLS